MENLEDEAKPTPHTNEQNIKQFVEEPPKQAQGEDFNLGSWILGIFGVQKSGEQK